MKKINPLTWMFIRDPQLPCMICRDGTAKHIAVLTEGNRIIMSPLVCPDCAELDEAELKNKITGG